MQPPYAKLRASIAGGAVQTGGLTAAGSATVQLSADPAGAAGITSYRWEIYDYPPGFALPSGWSSDSSGTYYSTAATPPVFTLGAVSSFGKYMLRFTANNGISSSPKVLPTSQLIDESTSVDVIGNSGLHDTGVNESNQWSAFKQWLYHVKLNWRIIDAFINAGGGGGGGGVTVHGALTGLSADDHTQYLRTDGTRALTGDLSAGTHKITNVVNPTSAQDAATKAYVDSVSGGAGYIKADGSVVFTGNQSLGGNKLTSVGTATLSGDAANKAYVDATIIPAGTNAFTGDQSMGGHKLTNVATPTSSTDVCTKGYADAIIGGGTQAVRLATAAALPINTRTANVLTAAANGALTVDGTAVVTGDLILVKNEATGANDGLFVATAAGSGGAPFVLTRTAAVIASGMLVSITSGTANGGKIAVLKTEGAIAVNSTALDFQIASGPTGPTGPTGGTGPTGPAGPSGVDAFNVIPGSNLTDASITIAPGLTGMKFTLPAGTLTANRTVNVTAGSGLQPRDVVFFEIFDVSGFTYTIRNGGTVPVDMFVKPVSPGCKRIYSAQYDGSNFFPCASTGVL